MVGAPALASTTSAPATAGAADTAPPSAVEDFQYPDAAKILQQRGIKLIKGDGHILLLDACGTSAQQIKVWTGASEICFQANAKTGNLTLEVPDVIRLQTADHPISADLTAEGTTQTVDVAKGSAKSVGEGTADGAPSVLVALRVTG
ncbi:MULTISPECIES: hypothetical protein [Streptomyces]|uniref:hypothetical protein n=1 Tax=Streptomyces TaxID=1883 RepID=UPI001E6517BD|nr:MULTISPECIES: hypothetical protein [Streptomyces]MCZ4095982.1 hypothetical protein [Streptomyces sp. H39-C1]